MSEHTKIAWCDSTVNFWRGCDKMSLDHPKGGNPSEWPEDLRIQERIDW